MGSNSHIEWTNHTFNPWWGCIKVSEGCKNCYAEKLDNRYNHEKPHWGPNSERKPMSVAYWKQPAKWDKEAMAAGEKRFVFCASMADWAESNDTLKHYPSQLMVSDARLELFQTIATTPNLIWQLLTKRPDNIINVIESVLDVLFMHDTLEDGNKEHLAKYYEAYKMLSDWMNGRPPQNVWIGTSVENQKAADERIPDLLKVPAKVRFLSCEPLLGPVDLRDYLFTKGDCHTCEGNGSIPANGENTFEEGGGGVTCPDCNYDLRLYKGPSPIHWVICGGESGPGARPMHPDWARVLCDQCKAAGVPFFFKQFGEYLPDCQAGDKTGLGNTDCIFPSPNNPEKMNTYWKIGKKESGSKLDGKEYKQFPKSI